MAVGGDRNREISAAALALIPFSILCAVYVVVFPPSPDEVAACDPIVRVLLEIGEWTLPAVGLLTGLGWLIAWPPRRDDFRSMLWWSVAVGGFVLVAVPALRVAIGPQLPSFVPPEEGARPGLLLSLAAGLVEESLFRLAVLPALLAVARSFLGKHGAALVASLGTGLLFALAHEVGANATSSEAAHFVARTAFPGAVLSLAAIYTRWTVPVVGHCAAHLLLPLLFD